ncbi:hypothetical protein BPORC_1847 [Bifidobacterium porcinum]|nr:hypothetical protein BPORC_1847 [Bifidobacterium porcinum]
MPSAGEKQQNDPSALNSHEKPGCYSSEAGSSKLSCPTHDDRRPHRLSQHIPQTRNEIRRSPDLLPTLSGVSASAEGRGSRSTAPKLSPPTSYAKHARNVTRLYTLTNWLRQAGRGHTSLYTRINQLL